MLGARPLRLVLLAFLALVLAGCGSDPASPPESSLPAPLAAELDSLLASRRSALGLHGAVARVATPVGEVWTGASGIAQAAPLPAEGPPADSGRAATGDVVHRIGSVTKSITATCALLLVDDDRLALDDTLASLLGEEIAPGADRITIRHLLSMRSGIPDHIAGEGFQWPPPVYTRAEIIELAGDTLLFPPGESFAYSNTNYVLLAMVVEELADQPIRSFAAARIFAPLGMDRTTWPAGDDPTLPAGAWHGYLPPGYVGSTWSDESEVPPAYVGAAGAVISTLADMDRWLEAWRGGELLSDSLAAEMWDLVAVEGAPGFGYGLGAAGLGDYRGHNGSVPGYESAVWEIAGHRIVVFTNGFCHPVELEVHTADAIAFAIGEHLLP